MMDTNPGICPRAAGRSGSCSPMKQQISMFAANGQARRGLCMDYADKAVVGTAHCRRHSREVLMRGLWQVRLPDRPLVGTRDA